MSFQEQISLIRWYIDTRPLTSATTSLPLLETLQPPDQETIKKYYHLKDRHMSLASYLLKYLFIHRSCRVPWNEIRLSRTPPPHSRPCFIPLPKSGEGNCEKTVNVEFNVSHQASLVVLAGTTFLPSSSGDVDVPQIGIDITCVDEEGRRGRKHANLATVPAFENFVDVFAEVFSPREVQTMKDYAFKKQMKDFSTNTATETEADAIESALRLFYTYWALKEAYIKMTGEALLAPWLRELEFTDVNAPEEPVHNNTNDNENHSPGPVCGYPYTGTQTWLYREKVEDVRIEVVGFEKDYLFATAARGGGLGTGSRPSIGDSQRPDPWQQLEKVDIERDIAPCATGKCLCLSGSESDR